MTSRVAVAVMGLALALYVAVTVWLAVMFFSAGTAVSIAMGVGLILLALIGGWALIREVVFGLSADRLGRTLDAEVGMPEAPVSRLPSGRLRREDVDPLLTRYAVADEDDWRAHYRLGVVQDAAGRRREARASIRRAITLARPRT